ncbi:4Fe-4S dicluster domain-containing protein, partial [candidate division KSB1 bacterium]|nr:4Fe-4S dicluster domain-containing protein [candidate division KSB1 bacterium]
AGFVLLLIGTTIVSFDYDVWRLIFGQESFLKGDFYLVFSLILDIAGVIALIGIVVALLRRYIQKPERLNNLADDAIFLILLAVVIIGGYFVEGTRLAAKPVEWAQWSPVGYWLSGFFSGNVATTELWHRIFWWSHLVLAFGFIAYIPFSKLFHMLSSPINIFFRKSRPKGELKSIDIETVESFGATQISDFTWKDLLDLDVCTRCGRCQDRCPAWVTDKPLSPKKIILDLQENMDQKGPELLKKKNGTGEEIPEPIVGTAVHPDEIWACTTCRACVESCPVLIEHIDKIVDMRRERVLMESAFPSELNQTFRGMENNFNPWGIGFSKRAEWAEGLDIPNAAEAEIDVLWYVGCAGSFDDRVKRVSRSFANIMEAAGVKYGILGEEEKCCGETARRLGNEYLAQTLMEMNVEQFRELGIKKIVTLCPHCFNTFKNEYQQFGAELEVYHYTEFIHKLIEDEKIKLKSGNSAVTFHDSCYLGRYNDIYDQPREIIRAINPQGVSEIPEKNRDESLCCGAGGGRMWMEENIGTRINHKRADQIMTSGAKTVISACPYCLTMFSDGIKEKEVSDKLEAMDIAEYVEKAMI